MRRNRAIAATLLGLLVLLAPIPALAQAPSAIDPGPPQASEPPAVDSEPPQASDPASPTQRPQGDTVWSFFSGFGVNHQINFSAIDINIATAGFRWSHLWSAKFGSFLRGRPAFALEIVPVNGFLGSEQTSWAAGGNLLYEHHFVATGRVLPVWTIGAGMIYSNREIPVGETKHNFNVLTGLGVNILFSDQAALFLGYRFHHVSNANTGTINPGINAHMAVFGVSLYR